MLNFDILLQFSFAHCIAICAFLVPANLLATGETLRLIGLRRDQIQIWRAVGVASILGLAMLLHVFTWFLIGVVMAPTYILLWLGGMCLSVNLWALINPASLRQVIETAYKSVASWVTSS